MLILTVFYCIDDHGNKYGSTNCYKIRKMYPGKEVKSCDISEFDGTLLSDEYID